jgi:membrane-associated phospholipid phosphatase
MLQVIVAALCIAATPAAHAEPYRPLHHLAAGARDLGNTESLVVLGAGTALTLGALAVDHSVRDYFDHRNLLGPAAKIGNDWLGTGVAGLTVGAGLVVYGLAASSDHELQAGEANLEGLGVTALFTNLLKVTVRRTRPYSDSHTSFPSGHASTTFASAANILDFYGPKAGVPALVLAAYTGVCRLDVGAHYLSDVLFGAALGFAVSHAYSLHHLKSLKSEDKQTFELEPWFDSRDSWGLALKISI